MRHNLALSGVLCIILAGAFLLSATAPLRASPLEAQALPSGSPEAARTVTYSYDGTGRLIEADYVGDAVVEYQYDPGGNLVVVQPGDGYNVYLPLVLRQAP